MRGSRPAAPPGERPEEASDRLARQSAALGRLARSDALARGVLAEFVRELAVEAAAVLQVPRLSFWWLDATPPRARCEHIFLRGGAWPGVFPERTATEHPRYFTALEDGAIIAANDAQHDSRTAELASSHLIPGGITSVLDAPIRLRGRTVGVISAEHVGAMRSWTPDEEQFAVTAASLVALALATGDQVEVESSLLDSDERYRELVENVEDVIYTISPEGFFTSLNKAFERTLGWKREDWVGGHFASLVHSDDLAQASDAQMKVLAGESPPSFELRIRDSRGEYRVGEFRAVPARRRGRIFGVLGVGRDVTARKRSEERTRALLDVARDIAGTLDLAPLLDRVLRRAIQVLPCDLAALLAVEPGASRPRVQAMLGQGELEQDPDRLRAFEQELLSNGHSLLGGTKLMVGRRDLASLADVVSLVSAPIHLRGQPFGALVAFSKRPDGFDSSQVELCEGMARLVTAGMGAAELFRIEREEARLESALARVGQEMISSVDAPVILERLCRVTREVLACDLSHTFLFQPEQDDFLLMAGVGDTSLSWDALRAIRVPRASVSPFLARLEHEGLVQVRAGSGGILDRLMSAYGVGTGMMVALSSGGRLVGVTTVGRYRDDLPFDPIDEKIARGIAHLASLALANASLFERVEAANRLKSEFVATMSHELRTPLHVILGFTELLLEGAFGKMTREQYETLERLGRSAQGLCELVNATLDLSRLEAGKITIERCAVPVRELIADVTAKARTHAERPNVELSCDIDPALEVIETDPGKLKTVLANLLSNAFKFTERGQVTLIARRAESGLEITVRDTGVGIPAELHDVIFESFRQGDASLSRRHGGAGLGLYIVRRLLGVLGGRISVQSEVGAGATFRVWLPLAPVKPAAPDGTLR